MVTYKNPLPSHMDVKKVLKDVRNTLRYHSEVVAVKKLQLTLMQDEPSDSQKKADVTRCIRKNEEAMFSTCQHWPEIGKYIYIRLCDRAYLSPIEHDIIRLYPGPFGEELRRSYKVQQQMKSRTDYGLMLCFIILNYIIIFLTST